MDDGTNYYYYLHDHLHSPAASLDNSGIVVERYEYDAYGKATIYDGTFSTTRDVSSFGNPYMFTGLGELADAYAEMDGSAVKKRKAISLTEKLGPAKKPK